jgi:signal transduction histidine kinase
MGPVTAEQRGALERIRMSGRHLLALQESLLEVAQLRSETAPVRLQSTVVGRIIRDAIAIVRPDADERRQVISVTGAAELAVLADPNKLRRVLINLISNAIKYTPPDGRITIAASASGNGEDGWGRIAVTDTGPGIAADRHEPIFQPYVRGDGAATDSTPGLGLGLTICRELVEQMGGTVDVHSVPGDGATFAVMLPLDGT